MIMRPEYLDELKDRIQNCPDPSVFNTGSDPDLTVGLLLADDELLEQLWTVFQKNIEDYDVDPDYAFVDACHEILGIPEERMLEIM